MVVLPPGWGGLIVLALGDSRGFCWWYWPVPHSDGTFSLVWLWWPGVCGWLQVCPSLGVSRAGCCSLATASLGNQLPLKAGMSCGPHGNLVCNTVPSLVELR